MVPNGGMMRPDGTNKPVYDELSAVRKQLVPGKANSPAAGNARDAKRRPQAAGAKTLDRRPRVPAVIAQHRTCSSGNRPVASEPSSSRCGCFRA